MEIFVDFGLFEVIVALGISALARRIYARSMVRIVFLLVSVFAPGAVIFLGDTEQVRWLGAVCLATALVNLSVVLGALQKGEVPTLTFERQRART